MYDQVPGNSGDSVFGVPGKRGDHVPGVYRGYWNKGSVFHRVGELKFLFNFDRTLATEIKIIIVMRCMITGDKS